MMIALHEEEAQLVANDLVAVHRHLQNLLDSSNHFDEETREQLEVIQNKRRSIVRRIRMAVPVSKEAAAHVD